MIKIKKDIVCVAKESLQSKQKINRNYGNKFFLKKCLKDTLKLDLITAFLIIYGHCL